MANGPEGATQANAAKPKKKKRGKLLIPVLVLLVAAAGAAAAYNHFNPGVLFGGRAETEEEAPALKSLDFGSTVVNLADSPGNRFFRVALVLEYPDTGVLDEEMSEKEYRIRDGLVFLLRQKTTADLRAPDAPDLIREEIREEINRHLEQGEIVNVYFTEFIIQ